MAADDKFISANSTRLLELLLKVINNKLKFSLLVNILRRLEHQMKMKQINGGIIFMKILILIK
jgi:hypothetical protein